MAISFSTNSDVIFPTADGQTYQGGGGEDLYVLTDAAPLGIPAGSTVTIDDDGANTIRLVGGLSITSSRVFHNTLQLTLSNTAVVNILHADEFSYDVGNSIDDPAGTLQTYAEMTESTLGVEAPADGEPEQSGGAVIVDGGTATTGFTVTQSVSSVDEGGTVTYTVTADQAVTADTTFNFEISGTEANAADFTTSTAGSVTILANQTTASFSVGIAANDGSEFAEDFTVTVTDASGDVVATLDNTILDTSSNDTTAPTIDTTAMSFDENQVANAVVGTITSSDADVASYAITGGNDAGYFAINATTGAVSITEAGVAAAINDYETDPNTMDLTVTATDTSGNVSDGTTVTVSVGDVDDVPPGLTTATLGGTSITLTFDETLDTASVPSPSSFSVMQNGDTAISVNTVTVNTSSVTLELASAPSGTVTVSYTPPATSPVQDVAGNDVAAITDQSVAVDTSVPTLSSSTPVDGTTDVAVGDDIVLTFSETVVAGTGNISLVSANGSDTRTISITDSQITISGNTVTINPTSDLANGLDYSVQIDSGALLDTSGNSYAGISDATTLNFTTEQPISSELTSGSDILTGNTFDGTLDILSGQSVETLTSGDRLTGSGTNPTLNVQVQEYVHTITPLSMTGIETVNVDASTLLPTGQAAGAPTLNFANVDSSVQNFSLSGQNQNFTLSNIANAISGFGINNNSTAVNFTANFQNTALSGTSDATTVTLNQVIATAAGATPTLTFQPSSTASGFETINVISGGALANAATLTDGNGNSLTTVNISGSQGLTLALGDTTVTTVDANASTGGVSVTAAAANAQNMTVTGGSGNDTINVNGYSVSDIISGGTAGTDTLLLANAEAIGATAAQSNVTNIDVIGLTDGLTGTVALTNFSATGFSLATSTDNNNDGDVTDAAAGAFAADVNGGLAGAGIINYDSGTANTLSLVNSPSNGNALTLNVSGALTTDTVSVTAGTTTTGILNGTATTGSGWGNGAITFNGAETVNLTSQGGANIFGGAFTLTDTAATESLNLTGNQNLSFFGAISANTINAGSFTGNLTMGAATVSPTAANITGGTGADLIWAVQGAGDILNGGDGNDVIIGGTGADIMTGGAGADRFVVPVGDTGVTAATVDSITDLTLGNTGLFDTVGINTALAVNVLNNGAAYTGSVNAATFAADLAVGPAFTAGADAYLFTANAGDQSGKTFLVVDVDSSGALTAADTIINVTGFSGALTASNIVTTGITLTGGADADVLGGTAAADTLNGGTGADTLNGGDGSDTLTGGGNASAADDDIFQLTGTAVTSATVNADTITDFFAGSASAAVDEIQFGSTFLGGNSNFTSANVVLSASNSVSAANSDDIYVVNDSGSFVESGVANVYSVFNGAAAEQGVFVANDGAGNSNIWYVNDSLDGTATDVTVADVVLIGVLTGVTAETLVQTDFAGTTV